MLEITFLEIFLRAIPEAAIFTLAGYTFARRDINKTSFCISSILLAVLGYLIRMLPIHFGVHSIIVLIVFVLLAVLINKIEVIKAISAGLFSATTLFICEWINVFILTNLFKMDIETAFKSLFLKIVYGIPSLLLFFLITFLVWYRNSRLGKVEGNVSSRENI